MIQMSNYRKERQEAKKQYKAKNYTKSCENYSKLYDEIPFDKNQYSF